MRVASDGSDNCYGAARITSIIYTPASNGRQFVTPYAHVAPHAPATVEDTPRTLTPRSPLLHPPANLTPPATAETRTTPCKLNPALHTLYKKWCESQKRAVCSSTPADNTCVTDQPGTQKHMAPATLPCNSRAHDTISLTCRQSTHPQLFWKQTSPACNLRPCNAARAAAQLHEGCHANRSMAPCPSNTHTSASHAAAHCSVKHLVQLPPTHARPLASCAQQQPERKQTQQLLPQAHPGAQRNPEWCPGHPVPNSCLSEATDSTEPTGSMRQSLWPCMHTHRAHIAVR
jgi:hypothetical protein